MIIALHHLKRGVRMKIIFLIALWAVGSLAQTTMAGKSVTTSRNVIILYKCEKNNQGSYVMIASMINTNTGLSVADTVILNYELAGQSERDVCINNSLKMNQTAEYARAGVRGN